MDTKTETLIFTENQEINSILFLILEKLNFENEFSSFINKKTMMKKEPRYQIRFNGSKTAGSKFKIELNLRRDTT
jgi:hypothetical protein